MRKWMAGIIGTVIAGVLVVWLVELFRPPTLHNTQNQDRRSDQDNMMGTPTVVGGPIKVTCSANPHVLSPGSSTELVIQVISAQNTPVSDANVRIETGGGVFLSSGSCTVVGRTDYSGSFRTLWRSPSPASPGYVMGVYVSKPGFVEGQSECRTIIR